MAAGEEFHYFKASFGVYLPLPPSKKSYLSVIFYFIISTYMKGDNYIQVTHGAFWDLTNQIIVDRYRKLF